MKEAEQVIEDYTKQTITTSEDLQKVSQAQAAQNSYYPETNPSINNKTQNNTNKAVDNVIGMGANAALDLTKFTLTGLKDTASQLATQVEVSIFLNALRNEATYVAFGGHEDFPSIVRSVEYMLENPDALTYNTKKITAATTTTEMLLQNIQQKAMAIEEGIQFVPAQAENDRQRYYYEFLHKGFHKQAQQQDPVSQQEDVQDYKDDIHEQEDVQDYKDDIHEQEDVQYEQIDTRSKEQIEQDEQDQQYLSFFDHDPTEFEHEDEQNKLGIEDYLDQFQKYVMSGIDYLKGGKNTKINGLISDFAWKHREAIQHMSQEQLHEFLIHHSRQDYDDNGVIDNFDQEVREKLLERIITYRDKRQMPVLTVDKNPFTMIEQTLIEDTMELISHYITPEEAISVHNYIADVQQKGVTGQDSWKESLKAAMVLGLTGVLEKSTALLHLAGDPLNIMINVSNGKPVMEGISGEQVVDDLFHTFSLLGTLWVGSYANYLATSRGIPSASFFLAAHYGKQQIAHMAGEAASKFAIEYGVAERFGPSVERAVGMAIAYQVLDGLPIDEVSTLAASGLSGMFFSDFIIRNSQHVISNAIQSATSAAITFVSPEPRQMKLFFGAFQAANILNDFRSLAMDTMQIPRSLRPTTNLRSMMIEYANTRPSNPPRYPYPKTFAQQRMDDTLQRPSNRQHYEESKYWAQRARGGRDTIREITDRFYRERVAPLYSPRLPGHATVVNRAPAAFGNVNYERALPEFSTEVSQLVANNQQLASHAIDIMQRGGVQNKYTPYLIHLIGGVATLAGIIGISYTHGTAAVVDKSKAIQTKTKQGIEAIKNYTLNSTMTPQSLVDIVDNVVGEGNKTIGQMSKDLGKEIYNRLPKNAQIVIDGVQMTTKDLTSEALFKLGLITLTTVGTTYAIDQYVKAASNSSMNNKQKDQPMLNAMVDDQKTLNEFVQPQQHINKPDSVIQKRQDQDQTVIFPSPIEKKLREVYEKGVQVPPAKLIFTSPEQRAQRHQFEDKQYNHFKKQVLKHSRQSKYKLAPSSMLGKRFTRGYIYDYY